MKRVKVLNMSRFQELKDELYRLSRDKKELKLYDLREKSFLDKVSALSTAEENGRKNERIVIAKNLLDVLDNETIALKTGLSVGEIESLRK